MRKLLLILVAVAVLVLWRHRSAEKAAADRGAATIEDSYDKPLAGEVISTVPSYAVMKSVSRVQPTPAATPTFKEQVKGSLPEVNPYLISRFSLRKLDLPMPASIVELFASLTDFKAPLLPAARPGEDGDGAFDGDVLTYFRGFYELGSDEIRRIALDHTTKGVTLSLEEADSSYHEWADFRGEISLKNFNGDPYSLVIQLPDQRMIYLKFQTGAKPDYQRLMRGWLIADAKNALRLALFDRYTPRNSSGMDDAWPEADSVKRALPAQLPLSTPQRQ